MCCVIVIVYNVWNISTVSKRRFFEIKFCFTYLWIDNQTITNHLRWVAHMVDHGWPMITDHGWQYGLSWLTIRQISDAAHGDPRLTSQVDPLRLSRGRGVLFSLESLYRSFIYVYLLSIFKLRWKSAVWPQSTRPTTRALRWVLEPSLWPLLWMLIGDSPNY